MWSETRWESRARAVEAIRYEPGAIINALEEVMLTANDGAAKSEAQSCQKSCFIRVPSIWYDILNTINATSNLLQTENFDKPKAVELLEQNITYFKKYREIGFKGAQVTAKEVAEELAILKMRVRRKKRIFDYKAQDDTIEDGPRTISKCITKSLGFSRSLYIIKAF